MAHGGGKKQPKQKHAPKAREQKPVEQVSPGTGAEVEALAMDTGDAAQDASEPEEETLNPELDIEIATGRRYMRSSPRISTW
jgi:hypothetical protein